MKVLGIGSNIMNLGGIAIAIGAMIDGAIVMIENAHKHLETRAARKPRLEVLIEAASQVGPALFFSLLIITCRSCRSSPWNRRRGGCSVRWPTPRLLDAGGDLSITCSSSHGVVHSRQIIPEHKNPINRFLIWVYRPLIRGV